MRTFKKSLLLILFFVSGAISAQNDEKEIATFKQSYSLEAKSDFTKAIGILKDIYKEDSY